MKLDDDISIIMKNILRKLIRMKKIGGAHTEIKNITKGLSSIYRNTRRGQKQIKKAIKELFNQELLLSKPSTGEIHVSINPRKIKEIREFCGL